MLAYVLYKTLFTIEKASFLIAFFWSASSLVKLNGAVLPMTFLYSSLGVLCVAQLVLMAAGVRESSAHTDSPFPTTLQVPRFRMYLDWLALAAIFGYCAIFFHFHFQIWEPVVWLTLGMVCHVFAAIWGVSVTNDLVVFHTTLASFALPVASLSKVSMSTSKYYLKFRHFGSSIQVLNPRYLSGEDPDLIYKIGDIKTRKQSRGT